MIIEQLTVTAFQQHTRILGCETTKLAICIDPGDEADVIVETLERRGLTLQAIGLTHAHLDHVGGVSALKKLQPDAKICLHRGDEPMFQALPEQPAWLGIPRGSWAALGFAFETPPPVDEYGSTASTITLEHWSLKCDIALVILQDMWCFTRDVSEKSLSAMFCLRAPSVVQICPEAQPKN